MQCKTPFMLCLIGLLSGCLYLDQLDCEKKPELERADCYAGLALKYDSPDLCDNSSNKVEQEYCYNRIAEQKKSKEFCNNYSEKLSIGQCYSIIATEQNNPGICFGLNEQESFQCFLSTSRKTNTDYCKDLQTANSPYTRDHCYLELHKYLGSEEYCEKITDFIVKRECYLEAGKGYRAGDGGEALYLRLSKERLIGRIYLFEDQYMKLINKEGLTIEEAREYCNELQGVKYFACAIDFSTRVGEELCKDIPAKRKREHLIIDEAIRRGTRYNEYKDTGFEERICLEHARSKGLNLENFILVVTEANWEAYIGYGISEQMFPVLGEDYSIEDRINLERFFQILKDNNASCYPDVFKLVSSLASEERNPVLCDSLKEYGCSEEALSACAASNALEIDSIGRELQEKYDSLVGRDYDKAVEWRYS